MVCLFHCMKSSIFFVNFWGSLTSFLQSYVVYELDHHNLQTILKCWSNRENFNIYWLWLHRDTSTFVIEKSIVRYKNSCLKKMQASKYLEENGGQPWPNHGNIKQHSSLIWLLMTFHKESLKCFHLMVTLWCLGGSWQ